MDAKILFQLNESYRHGVYNQIDEEVLSEEELLDIQEWVEALIEEGYDLDEYTDEDLYEAYLEDLQEATAMAKRGYDEVPIRRQIASNTGGGAAADRATALADKPTYGWRGANTQARQNLARKQRGDFRSTTSSNPGLHGYGHQSNDPAVKAKQAARGAQRGVLTPNERRQLNREEFDLYDLVSEYLVSEGFCDSYGDADVIMVNMSEEWRDGIVEEILEGFKPTGYSMGHHSSVTGRGRKARQIDRQIEKLKRSGKKGEAMAVDFVNRMQDTPEGRAEVMAISRQNKSRPDARALRDAQRDSRG